MSEHGDLIRKKRQEKGWTLRELATKIGSDFSYIYRIETGKQKGSIQILLKLADVLDIPKELLLVKIGLLVMDREGAYNPEIEDLEFSKLDPKVKKALLEIAPTIKKTLQNEGK